MITCGEVDCVLAKMFSEFVTELTEVVLVARVIGTVLILDLQVRHVHLDVP